MEDDTLITKKQYSFKVLVIGDPGTGKTSIIRRLVHNVFTSNYKATIGVDFALKIMAIDPGRLVHLQLWDISGQDRYGVMTRVYYKDAHAAVVVCDATRERTIEGAMRWKQDLDQKVTLADGSPVPAILVANKCDMDSSHALRDDQLHNYEVENGFIGAYRTSAKENFGVEEAFMKLVDQILSTENNGDYEIPLLNRDGNVRLGEAEEQKPSRSCCF